MVLISLPAEVVQTDILNMIVIVALSSVEVGIVTARQTYAMTNLKVCFKKTYGIKNGPVFLVEIINNSELDYHNPIEHFAKYRPKNRSNT